VTLAALAALLFRRSERWLMLGLTTLPAIVWYVLLSQPPAPLHDYDVTADNRLIALNAISISLLISLFGWLETAIYRRMERPGVPCRSATAPDRASLPPSDQESA
jgi:hypothetical protein